MYDNVKFIITLSSSFSKFKADFDGWKLHLEEVFLRGSPLKKKPDLEIAALRCNMIRKKQKYLSWQRHIIQDQMSSGLLLLFSCTACTFYICCFLLIFFSFPHLFLPSTPENKTKPHNLYCDRQINEKVITTAEVGTHWVPLTECPLEFRNWNSRYFL